MKINIEPTDKFAEVDGVPVRIWRGVTDKGTECLVLVPAIAVPTGQDQSEFTEVLKGLGPGLIVRELDKNDGEQP